MKDMMSFSVNQLENNDKSGNNTTIKMKFSVKDFFL